MPDKRIAIVGAGIGGLAAAVDLAARGFAVRVFERAPRTGGKMRELDAGGAKIDAGPTVFTMRGVFDALFEAAGAKLDDRLKIEKLDVLARHAWQDGSRLDLFADRTRSADAIGAFAGAAAARGYRDFCARAARVYKALDRDFMRAPRPSPAGLARALGPRGAWDLLAGSPFSTLWSALGRDLPDARLRQLFARYATYVGSSPFACPATLMLIAHVEQEGVWNVVGGMRRVAEALGDLARERGARIACEAHVRSILVRGGSACGLVLADGEEIEADAVICNADVAALAGGRFGAEAARAIDARPPQTRSLSATTWTLAGSCAGFPLLRHNVFFSRDYRAEFDAIFGRGECPAEPTVYVCAQDRADEAPANPGGPERFLVLTNAPARGDSRAFDGADIARCAAAAGEVMRRCGATIDLRAPDATATTPADFEALFPATGGALYGQASHGWTASFSRPAAATRLPGLFLAGGSVHPGAGVPMAALSGRLAAAAAADFVST